MHHHNEYERYRGLTYARLVRVSDASEKQNSDKAQLLYLKNWADNLQMVHVKDFIENDLSGSLPGNRKDLRELLDHIDTVADIKVVLSQRIDRATRGGADHLFWFEHELKRRGVKLILPGDGLPEHVPFRNTLVAAKADAAQETASSTAQRSAQGSELALHARRISPHSRTPFGCYRLYCRADGTPLFVIVDRRNGIQEKRSWPDLTLIDTYGTVGGGRVGHYKKQKSELVFLVPGDPYEQETVILIFTLRYIEGKSARKIAQHLMALGRPAPCGGTKWAEGQVCNIYENEDYTARGIANRESAARYFRRHRNGPQKVEHDDLTLTTADRLKPITREMMDWFEGDEPYLINFLKDEILRQTATAKQKGTWERRLDPTYSPANKKKYTPGPYILSPLLRCKQLGESLVGSLSGRPDHKVRVYRHKETKRNPQKCSIFGRTFNADALENGVLDVLRDILFDWPDLEPRLLDHLQRQVESAGQNDTLMADKQQQRQDVRDQLLLYIRTLTPKTQNDLLPEIKRLEAQRDTLDAEIDMLGRQRTAAAIDPKQMIESLKARLHDLAHELPNIAPVALMDVLAQLTGKLEADMETKNVEFYFHFPRWMLNSDAKTSLAALCTRANSESSTGPHTQRDDRLYLPLSQGTCQFVYPNSRSVECRCSRRTGRAA